MSPYPDDFNQSAYNAWHGTMSKPSDDVYEACAEQLNYIVKRAFEEWPLNTHLHADYRADLIREAMDKAEHGLDEFCSLGSQKRNALLMIYCGIFAANNLCEEAQVKENLGDWLYLYSLAIR